MKKIWEQGGRWTVGGWRQGTKERKLASMELDRKISMNKEILLPGAWRLNACKERGVKEGEILRLSDEIDVPGLSDH